MFFFNTTRLSGSDLSENRERAKNQSEIILGLMDIDAEYSADYLIDLYFKSTGKNILRGSMSRSLSVLTKEGRLTKVYTNDKSVYGVKICKWKRNA